MIAMLATLAIPYTTSDIKHDSIKIKIGREAHEKYISRRREPCMFLVLGSHAIQSGPEAPSSLEIVVRGRGGEGQEA